MSEIKIEDLRIGQRVWYKGEERTIDYLSKLTEETSLGLVGISLTVDLHEISLTPPKKKVKYYQWRKNAAGLWFRINRYLSEDGIQTDGVKYPDWDFGEKQKVMPDLDFVEQE